MPFAAKEMTMEITSEHTDEDMAAVGRATMAAIRANADPGWAPADCPSEIVCDLRNQRDELEADVERLRDALKRMVSMHGMMMAKTNHGASFYDAECLSEMNAAPLEAARALGHNAEITGLSDRPPCYTNDEQTEVI